MSPWLRQRENSKEVSGRHLSIGDLSFVVHYYLAIPYDGAAARYSLVSWNKSFSRFAA